ncbi:MAG: adenosylcobinamide-GDP ribazoletransferase [Rhodobacteraceae bacterium]|nr:adenosylcobinamide-GDP ribazoletransferase [Paracoccaceae bacterium]
MTDSECRDKVLCQWGDIGHALRLLTRLPMPGGGTPGRGGRAAWAWPLAGLVVGGCGVLLLSLALWLGVPTGCAAALALTGMIMATGALHEDGLADSADGLWGGGTVARRLEIMRDSRVGSYGVLALGLSLLARWSLITSLADSAPLALIAAAMPSRAAMAGVMALLPPARDQGLSHRTGRPPRFTVLLALGAACAGAVVLSGLSAGLTATLVACGAAGAVAALANAKIGGQTGDILGASQQMAEIAALAALAALLV